MSKIKDKRWTIIQKMSQIKRLKDHHDIGHIFAQIHIHIIIIEYNADAQILITRLVN